MQANPEAKLHRFSTTVEKERPQLNKETRDLIAAYRRDPSDANRAALREKAGEKAVAIDFGQGDMVSCKRLFTQRKVNDRRKMQERHP